MRRRILNFGFCQVLSSMHLYWPSPLDAVDVNLYSSTTDCIWESIALKLVDLRGVKKTMNPTKKTNYRELRIRKGKMKINWRVLTRKHEMLKRPGFLLLCLKIVRVFVYMEYGNKRKCKMIFMWIHVAIISSDGGGIKWFTCNGTFASVVILVLVVRYMYWKILFLFSLVS